MKTVSQPTRSPTRKMLAFTIGLAIAKVIEIAVTGYWPWLDDPAIWEPLPLVVEFLAPVVVGFLAGYKTKDRPNVDPYMIHEQRGV